MQPQPPKTPLRQLLPREQIIVQQMTNAYMPLVVEYRDHVEELQDYARELLGILRAVSKGELSPAQLDVSQDGVEIMDSDMIDVPSNGAKAEAKPDLTPPSPPAPKEKVKA